jgi:hypothetical protein
MRRAALLAQERGEPVVVPVVRRPWDLDLRDHLPPLPSMDEGVLAAEDERPHRPRDS